MATVLASVVFTKMAFISVETFITADFSYPIMDFVSKVVHTLINETMLRKIQKEHHAIINEVFTNYSNNRDASCYSISSTNVFEMDWCLRSYANHLKPYGHNRDLNHARVFTYYYPFSISDDYVVITINISATIADKPILKEETNSSNYCISYAALDLNFASYELDSASIY